MWITDELMEEHDNANIEGRRMKCRRSRSSIRKWITHVVSYPRCGHRFDPGQTQDGESHMRIKKIKAKEREEIMAWGELCIGNEDGESVKGYWSGRRRTRRLEYTDPCSPSPRLLVSYDQT
jgi:hypothetical protein